MGSTSNVGIDQPKEILDAQAHIWNHMFSFLKSMSLKCATELGIFDTLHNHGKPITLPELLSKLSKIPHPEKADSVHRIMRILTNSGFCSEHTMIDQNGNSVLGYALTKSSLLLVKDHPLTQVPLLLFVLDPVNTNPSHYLSTWFLNGVGSLVQVAHGESFWDQASKMQEINKNFNEAMACDAKLVAKLLLASNEFKSLFEGVSSVVDVGGGTGEMAKALAKAYPDVKFTVLDLSHVVAGLKGSQNMSYIVGDMFEAVPSTDVVVLKWILHDWSDKECIKVLTRCKEAIPSKEKGGKLIIIDMVVDKPQKGILSPYFEVQLLFDMEIISFTNGKERTEEEWKKLFLEAGFNDYNMYPLLGPRSIIEVYPA